MKTRALLFAATLAVGVTAPAASASADILIFYPPNPFQPPEAQPLVNQPTPVDVSIIFEQNPGPPNVINPAPSTR